VHFPFEKLTYLIPIECIIVILRDIYIYIIIYILNNNYVTFDLIKQLVILKCTSNRQKQIDDKIVKLIIQTTNFIPNLGIDIFDHIDLPYKLWDG